MTLAMRINEEREDAKIYGAIKMAKKYNASNDDIISDLCSEFNLTQEEAEEAIKDFEADE